MGELLLNHPLRSSDLSNEGDSSKKLASENARAVAQAQTMAVLEGLDSTRKRFLLQFLYYSALINKGKTDISLAGANRRVADLIKVDLREAYLRGANLRAAGVTQAEIDGARGDVNTKLPDSLQRPESWTEKS